MSLFNTYSSKINTQSNKYKICKGIENFLTSNIVNENCRHEEAEGLGLKKYEAVNIDVVGVLF